MTNEIAGREEPGFIRLSNDAKRTNPSITPSSLAQYARVVGALRGMAGKPLLELSIEEVEALDLKLAGRASVYRTVLKMFYRANKRYELAVAVPRQRKQKKPRKGLDTVLMPDDVMALMAAAECVRDRALIAMLAASGARISETLWIRMRDLTKDNGNAYNLWIWKPKEGGQERWAPKVEGAWKKAVDEWIQVRGAKTQGDLLFPSTRTGDHYGANSAFKMLAKLRKKTGITKKANPHWFRHSKITWMVINKWDKMDLSQRIWGIPNSPELNHYSHYSGQDMESIGEPRQIELPPVPAFPVVPAQVSKEQIQKLQVQMEQIQETVKQANQQTAQDILKLMATGKYVIQTDPKTGSMMVFPKDAQ